MADAALFVGYGNPVRGREQKAIAVFNESIQYWAGLQQQGKIESFDVCLLDPHGGDLNGFGLLRGSPEQVAQLRTDPGFQRLVARAQLIVENLGLVVVAMGQTLAEQMALYEAQLADLA